MKSIFSLTNMLMVAIIVGCISLILFSDRGLINLWSLKKEKLEIQNEINNLRNQIALLEKEEEKLKFDESILRKLPAKNLRWLSPVKEFLKFLSSKFN